MGETQKKSGIHYGWIICICMCIMQAFVVTIMINTASLFATPMSEALGVTKTEWMFWKTLYAISCFVFSPIVGAWLQNKKINFNFLLCCGAAAGTGAMLLFAFGTNLIMVYAAGLLVGFAQQTLRTNLMSFMASQWFGDKHRGKALGFINSSNGIGGMFVPLVVQAVIAAYGWSTGYLACAAMLACATFPFCAFVFKRDPADKGLQPVGYDAAEEAAKLARQSTARGASFQVAWRTAPFWCLMIACFFFAAFGGYKSNIVQMAEEFLKDPDYAAQVGALCLSIISFSDLISNILLGWLFDKFGEKVPGIAFACLAPAFMVCMLLGKASAIGFYVAALCYGFQGAWLRNSAPMLVRHIYGPKNFGKIFGTVNSLKNLMGGLSATIFAAFYDFGGGYTGALICGLVMVVGSLILIFIAYWFDSKDRIGWTDENYNDEEAIKTIGFFGKKAV